MRFFVALCLTALSAATTDPDYYSPAWGNVESDSDSIMPAVFPEDPLEDDELTEDIEYPSTSSQFTEWSTSSTSPPDHSITSESTPLITSESPILDEEKLVDYFSRHIGEVANISARLADLERVVSLQADLITTNKRSTELAKVYLLWNASVSSKKDTLLAVGYIVEGIVEDSRADLELAEADYIAALEEYNECTNLSGLQWKSVCDALTRTLENANETLSRAEARTRSWENKLRTIHQQKALLDSVDATPANELLSNFRRQQREVEKELAQALSHLMPQDRNRGIAFENALEEVLPRVEPLRFIEVAEDVTTETTLSEIKTTTPKPDVERA